MANVRKRGKRWQIDYFDPHGKRVRKSFAMKKEAVAELAKRVSLIAEGRYLDVKKEFKTTLGEVINKYVENFGHQSSYQTSKRFYITNIEEYFGRDTLLSNIKYMDIETYRNHLRQKPTKSGSLRKDSSVNREMSCLHHIFSKGVEWDMMEENPFDRGKSLILKENNKRLRFLTQEEIPKLLIECPKHLKRIVVCAINSGMRRGEILSLQWRQIRNGLIYLEKTKTNEARQIPINDTLSFLFKEIRKEKGFISEYVFTYAMSEEKLIGRKPVRKRKKEAPAAERITNIKRSFNSALKRAGIDDFRFHVLRHTFASQMILHGATLKDVQEILGHKTMTMTLRYAHLTQEHKKKAVNLLNGLTALSPNSSVNDYHKTVTKTDSRISALG